MSRPACGHIGEPGFGCELLPDHDGQHAAFAYDDERETVRWEG